MNSTSYRNICDNNVTKLEKSFLEQEQIKNFCIKNLRNIKPKVVNLKFLRTIVFLLGLLVFSGTIPAYGQAYMQFAQVENNYVSKSSVFQQEIAKMEISVTRENETLPLTQVPRVQTGDVLKVRMLDEAVNGIKPDQSRWDWTLLVAFINPGRNPDKQKSVTQEVQLRKQGWYREYAFSVPYDSQPVIFLYPKAKYRDKILKAVNQDYDQIRKIGEKTVEIAGAYAQIGMFLNELQLTLNRTMLNNYSYGGYGYGFNQNNNNLFGRQTVESLARSFNIKLPNCWNNQSYYGYQSDEMDSGSNLYRNDFASKVQCVAQSVRIEDLDISLSKMLQQGGVVAAAQLSQKYPQIAYWIGIAAAALDIILKITRKTPLKIVPTIVATSSFIPSSTENNNPENTFLENNFADENDSDDDSKKTTAAAVPGRNSTQQKRSVKVSLYAESQPTDNEFVTAFPVVVHKWQADPDPEVISLNPPALLEPCLHIGQNTLMSTDLGSNQVSDAFTRDYKLIISSENGFRKEFPLKKNLGLTGWEFSITQRDLNDFPKINMMIESQIVGKRGFNEIKSPKFYLPIEAGGKWEVKPETMNDFTVGGKRTITLQNSLGSCRCLQAVVYKPSFGGQFVFDAKAKKDNEDPFDDKPAAGLKFSEDGREVSFEIDTTEFQPGVGRLELIQFGGQVNRLNLRLFAAMPQITNFKMKKGDNFAIIKGDRLEQIQYVKINGKRAVVVGNKPNISESLDESNKANNSQNQNRFGNLNPDEKAVVFENPEDKETSDSVSLELGLEENRVFQIPQAFKVGMPQQSRRKNGKN